MSINLINIGTNPNDSTGDTLRDAFDKCNTNFVSLRAVTQQSIPATAIGSTGDTQGLIAADNTHLYICTADYDGSTEIWRRVGISTW